MRILLVAGSPKPSSSACVQRLAEQSDFIMAIDRGAEACRTSDVIPDAFCGDADTVPSETLAWVQAQIPQGANVSYPSVIPADDTHETPVITGLQGTRSVYVFEPAKYDTDLSLGFSCARQIAQASKKSLSVWVTCASGGRMDHALGVFGVLASNADIAPRLVEDETECHILSPQGDKTWHLSDASTSADIGQHFSCVALADNSLVSEHGMKWELDHYRIDALRDRGISNEIAALDASITCHRGIVAGFLITV